MKKKYKILISSLVLLFFLAVGIRYYILNTKYPNPEVQSAKIGETLEVGQYQFRIDNWEWHTGEFIDEILPNYTYMTNVDGSEYPADKIRIILATITISKTQEDDTYLDLTSFAFESGAWHNQWDSTVFEVLNPDISGLELKLSKEESATVVFPIEMIESQFTKKDWKHVEDRTFDIVLSCYPVKYRLVGEE